MGWIENAFSVAVRVLWKIAIFVVGLVIIGALVHWGQNNPAQAQSTTDKVMTAGASTVGWAADGVTSMTGGDAAHEGTASMETIWVQSTAPARWQVNRAIMVWNRGLTGVQLKAGECQSGSQCIKVSQGQVYTPKGESLILGKTSTWFGKKIKFNSDAVGRVTVSDMAYTSCHELGHALGVPHSASKLSCMYPSAKGAAGRPAQADFDAVNSR